MCAGTLLDAAQLVLLVVFTNSGGPRMILMRPYLFTKDQEQVAPEI